MWRTDHPADGDRPDLAAEGPGRFPEALAVAPGGGVVAIADSGAITVSRTRSPTAAAAGSARLTGNAAVTGLRFLDQDQRLVSASGSSVALWDVDQLARSARWTPAALPNVCNACSPPAVAVSPDGAFVALVPNHAGQVTITVPPAGAGAPQPTEVLIADHDIAEVRWTDSGTLDVTLSGAAPVALRDGGADGPVVATASAPAEGTASLRGRMPVDLVVRVAAAGDDEAGARTRAEALVAEAWARMPHDRPAPGRVALAPDWTAAAAVVAGDVWLIDLGGGAVTTLPIGDAVDVALTADRLLVSRSGGPLEIRDRATHAVVASVRGGAALGASLVTTPDGSRPVKARRLTQDEGTYLLRLVRRGAYARPAARACACPKPSPAPASSPWQAHDEPRHHRRRSFAQGHLNERRRPDCNLFCRRIDTGGHRPLLRRARRDQRPRRAHIPGGDHDQLTERPGGHAPSG